MVSDHVTGDGTLPTPVPAEGRPAQPDLAALSAVVPERIVRALGHVDFLSPRETAVFELLGQGCNNRDIAQELTLSERTVKRHVSALLDKLKVESRLQVGLVAQLNLLLGEIQSARDKGRVWP